MLGYGPLLLETVGKSRGRSRSDGEINRHISSLGNRDGLEDPLEDTGLVQQQLDQLSTIGRCEYEKTCALLVQLFDQSAQSYQELLQSASASPMDIAVQEGEWTVDWAWYGGDVSTLSLIATLPFLQKHSSVISFLCACKRVFVKCHRGLGKSN